MHFNTTTDVQVQATNAYKAKLELEAIYGKIYSQLPATNKIIYLIF
jgi:hypothetical protein